MINTENVTEGHSGQNLEQQADLIKLSENSFNVMEIGFNGGHSAETFLKNNPNIILTSFDIGEHDYLKIAKDYIDTIYPGRHILILGDSTITIPKYILENKNKTFDIIFIDGCHESSIAKADLDNCMKLANKNTIVILDDTVNDIANEKNHNIGPNKPWKEHIMNGTINQIKSVDYGPGRGMSWGKYNLI